MATVSLESTNPALRAALANLVGAPTVEHHLAVARVYRDLRIVDDALDYLHRSLTVNGPSSAVYDALARLWRDEGSLEHGLADAHRAVYYAPQSAAARNTLGTLLHRLGQLNEAGDQYEAAVRLDGSAWYAWSNLCQLRLAQGRTLEAIAHCRQADSLRPKSLTPKVRP